MKDYYKAFTDFRKYETISESLDINQLFSGTKYEFTVSAVTGGGVGDGKTTIQTIPATGKAI